MRFVAVLAALVGIGVAMILVRSAYNSAMRSSMFIESPAFQARESIPVKYTCDGTQTIPPLRWSGVPGGAKSLALIVEDPDTARGTFVHWTVWNIPSTLGMIMEGKVPAGAVEGANGTGKPGYIGPCPPQGTHRYFFKLYALDTVLALDEGTGAADLRKAMEGHVLEETEVYGTYVRK